LVFYIQRAPNIAATAVATDQIVRADGFLAAGFLVEDFG
jgi:hypothetical protein